MVLPLTSTLMLRIGDQVLDPFSASGFEGLLLEQALNKPSRLEVELRDPQGEWQKRLLGSAKASVATPVSLRLCGAERRNELENRDELGQQGSGNLGGSGYPGGSSLLGASRNPRGSGYPSRSHRPNRSLHPKGSGHPGGSEHPTEAQYLGGSGHTSGSRSPGPSEHSIRSRHPSGLSPNGSGYPIGASPIGSRHPTGSRHLIESRHPIESGYPDGSQHPSASEVLSSSEYPIGSEVLSGWESPYSSETHNEPEDAAGAESGELFWGTASCLELTMTANAGQLLRLVAHDPLASFSRRFAHRLFREGHDLAILRSLSRDHGLGFSSTASTLSLPAMMQDGEDDLSFLRELSKAVGRDFFHSGKKLHWLDLSQPSGALNLTPFLLKWGEGLEQVSVTVHRKSLPGGVLVPGSDPITGRPVVQAAAGQNRGSSSPEKAPSPSAPQAFFAAQKGQAPSATSSTASLQAEDESSWTSVRSSWSSSQNWQGHRPSRGLLFAQSAEAKLEQLRRQSEQLSAHSRNTAQLAPGWEVEIQAPDLLARGRWLLSRVVHRWGPQEGVVTSIEGFRAPTEEF